MAQLTTRLPRATLRGGKEQREAGSASTKGDFSRFDLSCDMCYTYRKEQLKQMAITRGRLLAALKRGHVHGDEEAIIQGILWGKCPT